MRFITNFYEEHGAGILRYCLLGFVFGTAMAIFGLWPKHGKAPVQYVDLGLTALGFGLGVMLITCFMSLTSALWKNGAVGKFCSGVTFLLGLAAVVGFIYFAAPKFRAL